MKSLRQFGSKTPGSVYVDRPSVYAVVFDNRNWVLVVLHNNRYYLPGGGVDLGETFEDALHREVMEEVGWRVAVRSDIGVASEYVDVPDEYKYYNKIGHFYRCDIVDTTGSAVEEDHQPMWVTVDELADRAAHQSHVWAVKRSLSIGG